MSVMLNHVNNGKLTLEQLMNLVCENPVKIFGIQNKGFIKESFDADFTIVDFNKVIEIRNDKIESKCGWSPFTGDEIKGWPVGTMVRGKRVMWEAELVTPSTGRPIVFNLSG